MVWRVYRVAVPFVQVGPAVPVAVIVTVTVVLSGCFSVEADTRSPLYHELRRELLSPEPASSRERDTPGIRAYYRTTAGIPADVRHDTLVFQSLGDHMAVHLFYPSGDASPSGTVLVVHGYLAYPADMASIIRMALAEGYVVAAPALPGHGLSGGAAAGIESFSDYGRFVADLLDALAELNDPAPHPWYAVGHSTGATALYEYLRERTTEEDPFEAVVFLAPLIRSTWYRASQLGRFLTRPFVHDVPSGADVPLVPDRMPLSWFDAQVRWNRRSRAFPVLTRPVLVVQGNADTVVDWRYNQQFLERKLACMRFELLSGAEHVLHGRDSRARTTTLDLVRTYIREYPEGAPCR